ncbi:hypothetical protein HanRHA438_Chr01g0046001 [Helianthus annuus]|nr:hypothetical protein HanRHA438_Chr01g0046001 [Helianthus annuus]
MIFRDRKLSFDGSDTRTESTTGVRKVDVVGDQLSQISKHENLKFEFCFILRNLFNLSMDKTPSFENLKLSRTSRTR